MLGRLTYRRAAGTAGVAFNVTPLVDCTLQLMIFFILTSQIASKSLVPMQLHRPAQSQAAQRRRGPGRVVVNVISAADAEGSAAASHYEIDGVRIALGDTDRLAGVLRRRKALAAAPHFAVEIRADARVAYEHVAPVMAAATKAEVPRMNVTALLEEGG